MGLKKTRTILSVILAIIMGLSTFTAVAALVTNITLGSPSFLSKHLITDEVVAECEAQLSDKYAVLEQETGIPQRVFEAYKNDLSIEESMNIAVQNVYGAENSSLYSEERVEYFYSKCTEYLEAKGVEYSEENVRLAADKAARIYSDCVGIHNVNSLKSNKERLERGCGKYCSVSLLVIISCIIMLTVLYRKRQIAYSYFAGGLLGGGIAGVLTSAMCLIGKVGYNLQYYPDVFQHSINGIVKQYFNLLLLAFVIICIIGISIDTVLAKKINNENLRNATRFSKILGRF